MSSDTNKRPAHSEENTIHGLLTGRAATLRDLPFIAFEGTEWSYGETLAHAEAAARALMSVGCAPGTFVGVMLENRLEFLSAWFGTALAGGVHVPVNLEYRGEILAQALQDVGARIVVCEGYLLPTLFAAMEGVDHRIETVIALGDAPSSSARADVRVMAWQAFLEEGACIPAPEFVQRSPYELGTIMLTSGTTGVSKGVMLTDKHCITHAREAAEAYGMLSNDVMYTCLPLFHGNAQYSTVLCAMTVGARVALSRRFSASRFWADVTAAGATQVAFLGTMLHILMAQPAHADERRHRVRNGNSVPCPLDVMVAFERRFGFPLLETYGNTETKRILSNRHYLRRIGSAGFPTATSIVEIHDEDGWAVAPGVIGEIVYRPKEPGILTLGYLNRPEATLSSMRNGWWCTGDLARQDTDGFFYFEGRKKDALRRRGENISAYEVERAIMKHGGVLHVAVVAVPSEQSEDEILAVVVPKPGSPVREVEIFQHANDALPYFMVPRFVAFVESIPQTPTGKISKAGLAEEAMKGAVWDSAKEGLSASRSRALSTARPA